MSKSALQIARILFPSEYHSIIQYLSLSDSIQKNCNEFSGRKRYCTCASKQNNKAPSYKGDTMSFEKDLFNQIKAAIPTMNVRRFSKYCGKSDGYYGSITAQALPISTNALLHLAEMLTHVQSHTPSKALDRALVMITETVAHRMQIGRAHV